MFISISLTFVRLRLLVYFSFPFGHFFFFVFFLPFLFPFVLNSISFPFFYLFSFVGQLGGTFLFILGFAPYHIGNLIRGHLSNQAWCDTVTTLICISVTLCCASNFLIAMHTYQHIYLAINAPNGKYTSDTHHPEKDPFAFHLTPRLLVVFWLLAILQGLWWFGYVSESPWAGSYRGMYCLYVQNCIITICYSDCSRTI